MFHSIGEKISVVGVYQGGHFLPKKFAWKTKVYPITKITLISDIKDGAVRLRLYSVLSETSLYRLLFNRETENWKLEEIWCD